MSLKGSVGLTFSSNNCGDFIIQNYISALKIKVKFVNTGYVTFTSARNIRAGEIKDKLHPNVQGKGYIGAGEYTTKSISYGKWADMLKRCYSPSYQKKQPTYIGVTVCEDWYNYQNFAKWYEDQPLCKETNVDLDKDVKSLGTKIYSPETCMLISRHENVKKAKGCLGRVDHIVSPEGVPYEISNRYSFCKEHHLPRTSFCRMLEGEKNSCHGWTLFVK